ncbi:MAG: hypothetical protein OXJ52_00995 [Oligoflexia bacterium]|nr:hypothetical protein [Oligoflexia bacterium]
MTFKESQEVSQKRCGQVLKSLKGLWIHPCSQVGYGVKRRKVNFCISAHPLSFEFKRIYGVWGFKETGETSSLNLTTLTHHFARVVRFREDVSVVK